MLGEYMVYSMMIINYYKFYYVKKQKKYTYRWTARGELV